MACLPFLRRRRLDSISRHPEFGDDLAGIRNVNLYMYKELRIATNDFHPENKIGEGGFGFVYKAQGCKSWAQFRVTFDASYGSLLVLRMGDLWCFIWPTLGLSVAQLWLFIWTYRTLYIDGFGSGKHTTNTPLSSVSTSAFPASHSSFFRDKVQGKLRDGQMAAIKVLSAESRQGVKEFLTEIQMISDIDHENLVKLYGCCVEGTHRILVYNYLENNSLARTLLVRGHSNIYFSWKTRVKICLGVARGLSYLHEEVRPHVIHRDIKASNILLDKDLSPKISDFGLAKLIPASMTHVSTRVAGTLGYLAPEYAVRGQLTRKADLYSFGVLLIEIVCGRCNTNTRLPPEEQYILERTWKLYERKELVVLVDTALDGDFDAEQACRFLKIGLLCTQGSPKLRPSMSKVVRMLTGETDVDGLTITQPGLISDLMDLNVRGEPKSKPGNNQASSSYNSSSLGDPENTTTSTSAPSSQMNTVLTMSDGRS